MGEEKCWKCFFFFFLKTHAAPAAAPLTASPQHLLVLLLLLPPLRPTCSSRSILLSRLHAQGRGSRPLVVPTSDLHSVHAWQVHAGRKTQNRPRRMRQEPCRLGCPQGGSLAWFFFFHYELYKPDRVVCRLVPVNTCRHNGGPRRLCTLLPPLVYDLTNLAKSKHP